VRGKAGNRALRTATDSDRGISLLRSWNAKNGRRRPAAFVPVHDRAAAGNRKPAPSCSVSLRIAPSPLFRLAHGFENNQDSQAN
jgi:hypothetical protein